MARHSRLFVLQALRQQAVLPIFYHQNQQILRGIAQACAEGGAPLLEFTNRGDRAFLSFAELESFCAQNLPHTILGAGSVIDAETAALYINAGAAFIVGPNFDPAVAKLCNKRKIPYIPGCGSVSEIVSAYETGVEYVKLFPAREVGGPSFVKAVKGPLPHVSIVATGGVEIEESSFKEWFSSGVDVVGLGSALFPAAALESGDFKAVSAQVKKAVDLAAKFRRIN